MTPLSLPRRRPWLRWLMWLAALAVLAGVLQTVSLAAVWLSLSRVGPGPLMTLAAANGLALILLTGRWWLLLRAWGFVIPILTLLGYRLAVFGVSYFTPGPQFGGEPLQVYLVNRHHRVPPSTAVAAVTLDKLLELLVNFAFLAGGVLVIARQQLFPAPMLDALALLAASLLALPVGALLLLARHRAPLSSLLHLMCRLAAPLAGKQPAWASGCHRAIVVARASERQLVAFYQAQPAALLAALLASILSWGALVGEYWLMLHLLGAQLSLWQMLAALTAARLAILFPLPGGLGVLEASQVFAMTTLGLDPALGLSAALLIRLRDVLLAAAGLWWGGLKS